MLPLCKTRELWAEPYISQRASESSVEEEITASRTIRDGSLKEVVASQAQTTERIFTFELGRLGEISTQDTAMGEVRCA